jgi:uncharacterized membrane protein
MLMGRPEGTKASFGDRVADHVTAFGGSWTFIFLTFIAIAAWMVGNGSAKSFDPFPYILLNLVLAVLTVLQAPLIMMSQNRQAARDRQEAKRAYETNAKAEMEIAALQAKLDEIRETQWKQLLAAQEEQLALLADLMQRVPEAYPKG